MTDHGFGKKMAMTLVGVITIIGGFLMASAGTVHAKSTYLSAFNTAYGTSGTALNTCSLCHPGGDTKSFNPYATAFGNAGHSFTSIESQDSDGDGFANKAEIDARTFPGDAASKPASTPPPTPADTTPPTVSSTSPTGNQTGVAVNATVRATFSETMSGASLTAATFVVTDSSGNPVAGAVTLAGATATFVPASLLANGATYTATVTTGAKDLAGNALAQAYAWNFTAVTGTSDADGDGIPDNMDGFPNDSMRATVPNPMGGENTTIDTSSNPGTRLMMVDGMADTDPLLNQAGKPAGYEFRHGVVAFVLAGVTPGGTANVVISFPSAIPADAKIYKVDSAGFHEYPGAVINGNAVTMTLKDGGAGDADGVANGVIDDPVAVATPVTSTTPTPSPDTTVGDAGAAGGGCSVAGTGGGAGGFAGSFGFLALAALALLARKAIIRKR